jgi:putative ergosteryl-3beta-O-L-aspartate hydrolase
VFLLRAVSRTFQRINSLIERYFTSLKVLSPAFTVTIPAKLSKSPGNISLYFYLPHGYTRSGLASSSKKDWALVINFHGGGFTIGHPTDDSPWATTLLNDVDAVFVSVGYRKGPEHPQPTAVEDCVDAVRWLWAHAEEYGFDRSRTVITVFSAGGNLCFTTPLRHYRERKAEDAEAVAQDGKVTGIVAFYPPVNQAIPQQQKVDSNPLSKTKGAEPPWLRRIIDDSYYQNLPPEGRASLNLSPALAPKDALQNGLPDKIAIFTCEWDKLLVEAEDFRRELKTIGKIVGGEMIANVGHGFDKWARKYPEERRMMYRDAVKQIKTMV